MIFLNLELVDALVSPLEHMCTVMLVLYAENREHAPLLAVFERIYSGEA